MLISIVIPSLNQAEFIKQSIDSILNQNNKETEIIVVDGRSTDGTHAILQTYEATGKITWLRYNDKNQVDAINYGLTHANGSILTYLAADDLLTTGTLEYITNIFTTNKQVMWLIGDTRIIDEVGKEIHKYIRYYKSFLRLFGSYKLLGVAIYISQPGTFWRREVMDKIGLFDETLNYTMDYDYWLRIFEKWKPFITTRVLSAFRVHNMSKSTLGFKKQFLEGYTVAKKHFSEPILFLHRLQDFITIMMYNFLKN